MLRKTTCTCMTCVLNLGETLFASETTEAEVMQDQVLLITRLTRRNQNQHGLSEPRHSWPDCPETRVKTKQPITSSDPHRDIILYHIMTYLSQILTFFVLKSGEDEKER